MKLVVYADDSGTHSETGIVRHSESAVVAGYAGKSESWDKFTRDWQGVLTKYSAQLFHFCEWTEAHKVALGERYATAKHKEKNPYYGWDVNRLENFRMDLAQVAAGGGRIIVGGYGDTKRAAEVLKQNPQAPGGYTHEMPIWWFYESMIEAVTRKWPRSQAPISVFFDQSDKVKWRNAVTSVHLKYVKQNSRISEIAFADKKLSRHSPLQAADMVAYRLRQVVVKYLKHDDREPEPTSEFDRVLFGEKYKNVADLFPNQPPP